MLNRHQRRASLRAELAKLDADLHCLKKSIKDTKAQLKRTGSTKLQNILDTRNKTYAELRDRKVQLDKELSKLSDKRKKPTEPPNYYYYFYIAAAQYLPPKVVKAIETEAHSHIVSQGTSQQ